MSDVNLLKTTFLLTKRNQSHKKIYNLKNTPYFKFSFLSCDAKIKTPLLTHGKKVSAVARQPHVSHGKTNLLINMLYTEEKNKIKTN